EQIEFLQETIESQKLYLEHQAQQLHELGQELRDTDYQLDLMNQELQQMYYEYWTASSLKPLTLAQSKELAQILLASGESATHVVAQLLSAIYGAPVESSELEQRQKPSPIQLHPTAMTKLNQIQVECEQLQVQLNNLRERYGTLQDLSAKMKAQREERVRLRATLSVNLQVIKSEIGKHYKQRKID
ncbi:MAG TPA: hypothetical protein V6C85_09895, partial [Allocoleopsis sp.]